MRHCSYFKANDRYFLIETDIFTFRELAVGICPICLKPIAELIQQRFDGKVLKKVFSGDKVNSLIQKLKDEILYSASECNYLKFKQKPFGWKYGVNKSVRKNSKEVLVQYAYDFYGNKELVKTI